MADTTPNNNNNNDATDNNMNNKNKNEEQDEGETTKTKTDNNGGAIQVHANPDPEPVCEVVEDHIPEEASGRFSTNSSIRASTLTTGQLHADEQQNLEPVVDTDLPSDDINEPTKSMISETSPDLEQQQAEEVEVPYEAPPPPAPMPTPVVIDEDLPDDINKSDVTKTTTMVGSDDKCCVCRCCACPNGASAILFGQFFLFCGIVLCSWAMSDCKFIQATAGFPEPYYPQPYQYWNTWPGAPPTPAPSATPTMAPLPDQRRGFGFVFNETTQGGCNFYGDRYYHADEFENYLDFLGSDWNIPRILGGTALTIGWLLWFGTFMMWCCTCIKAVRLLTGTVLILVVAGLQSSTFAVIGSSFCDQETYTNCEPDRGWWMMLTGIICYLLSGIFFCCMRDYPGPAAA